MITLIALALPCQAQAVSEAGIGPAAGMTDAGDPAVGFTLATANEDVTALRMLFAPKDAEGRVVRSWTLEVGRWGPLVDEATPEVPMFAELETEEPEPEREVMLAIPHFKLGGDFARHERFQLELDLDGLLNIPGFARVSPADFYVGPSAGAGLRVAYASREAGGAGTGGVRLNGGLQAGAILADLVTLRIDSGIRLDPFVGDATMRAGALFGLSLLRFGAPLGLTVAGEGEKGARAGEPLGWNVRAALLYQSAGDDEEEEE